MSKQRKRQSANHAVSPGSAATQAAQLNQTVAHFSTIIDTFARHGSINLLDNQRRQHMFAAYVFGMLLAYGKREGLPPPTVLGAMNMLLVTKFGYGMQSADHLTHELLNATQPEYDTLQHTVIYRGIAGFGGWTTQGHEVAVNDFLACVATVETVRTL